MVNVHLIAFVITVCAGLAIIFSIYDFKQISSKNGGGNFVCGFIKFDWICDECGLVEPTGIPLIVKGWETNQSNWPWHAILYNFENGNWTFRCGGSLISEFAVVTAAHCVWKLPPTQVRVALGKKSRDYWLNNQNSTQIISSDTIIVHPLYQDYVGNYACDIAIIILEKNVQFSWKIRPICIDWKDVNSRIFSGSIGLGVGMGITENGTLGERLWGASMSVVDYEKCLEKEPRDFRKYVSFTSFCAGWGNGTGVCNGDSGGGLVFPRFKNGKRWVIEGIVSVSPKRGDYSLCDPNFYTVFTRVGLFVDWIKQILEENAKNVQYN